MYLYCEEQPLLKAFIISVFCEKSYKNIIGNVFGYGNRFSGNECGRRRMLLRNIVHLLYAKSDHWSIERNWQKGYLGLLPGISWCIIQDVCVCGVRKRIPVFMGCRPHINFEIESRWSNGWIRSVQDGTECLWGTISGSEGFTLTSLTKNRGSKN